MSCPVCRAVPAEIGVLCEECRDELVTYRAIATEQIIARSSRELTTAALVDVWGRALRLGTTVTIGREVDLDGVQVLDPSISRRHARISCDEGRWTLVDTGSTNGTRLDGVTVTAKPLALRDGARILFGTVAFFFVLDATQLHGRRDRRAGSDTSRPPPLGPAGPSTAEIAAQGWIGDGAIVMSEPTGGGGCMAEIEGKLVQLTLPMQELLSLLMQRMDAERDVDEHDRGFVAMSELVTRISLDSSEANMRQLVRRIRRALLRAGIADLIESRHGRGYRLRVR